MVVPLFESLERRRNLPADVIEELRRLLFATAIPQVIIGCAAVLFCVMNSGPAYGPFYAFLGSAAGAASLARVITIVLHQRRPGLMSQARWETTYAGATAVFSLILAAFAFHAIIVDIPSGETMATILVISYCAGIVARMSVRPAIAMLNIVFTAGPLAIAFAIRAEPVTIAISVVLFAMIYGSLSTVRHTYDITVEHLLTRYEVRARAGIDDLTRLANRAHLTQRLDVLFAKPRTTNLALHFIDIDHFKAINDGFGHSLGDIVLYEIARRIEICLPHSAFAARIGGDEFVVVQPDTNEAEARRLAARIVEAVDRPYVVANTACRVGASCGCQMVAPGISDWRASLAAADNALYEAKRDGRGRVVYSEGGTGEDARKSWDLTSGTKGPFDTRL